MAKRQDSDTAKDMGRELEIQKTADVPEPATSEPVVPDPATSEPVVPDPATSEPVVPEPATSEPVVPEPATSKPVVPEPATSKPVVPEPATSKPVVPGPALPQSVISEHYKTKDFENSLITWTVSNFSFSSERSYGIKSAEFMARFRIFSYWCLRLEWNPLIRDNEEPTVTLYLIRTQNESEPVKDIRVSVRFGFVGASGKKYWYPKIVNGSFGYGTVSSISTGICPSRSDSSFKVLCHMILYRECPAPEPLGFPTADALQRVTLYNNNFSKDEQFYDMTLQLVDGCLPVNKKILCSRSPVFKKMVEESEGNIHLDFATKMQMQQLVLYLYCNSLFYHSNNYIHFDLFDIASKLEISELVSLLRPKEINISSKANGGNTELVWKLENFSSLIGRHYVTSPTIESDHNQLLWCIKVFQTEEKVSFFVVIMKGDKKFDVLVKVCALNNEGKEVCRSIFAFPYTEGKTVGNMSFILKDEGFKEKYLTEDILTVICRVSHSDLAFSTSVDRTADFQMTDLCLNPFVNNLSERVTNLLKETGMLTIKAGEKNAETSFIVHRSVLRIRSKTLDDFLKKVPIGDPNALTINVISGHIMQHIIRYIYKGQLIIPNFNDALDIYEASFHMDVDLLREICVSYLECNLNSSNSSSVCRRAHNHEDVELKKYVIRYVLSLCPQELNSKEWLSLLEDNSELKLEIEEAKNDGFSPILSESLLS